MFYSMEDYVKLKKLKKLAEDLEYAIILQIIDNSDEIREAYRYFKEDAGMTDKEINLAYEQINFQKDTDNKRPVLKIRDALNLFFDLEVREVLQVYEKGNRNTFRKQGILFEALLEDDSFIVGELRGYKEPMYLSYATNYLGENEEEALEVFLDSIKSLNPIKELK